jgi:hypothetical protein
VKGDAALLSLPRNLNPRLARDMTFLLAEVLKQGPGHSRRTVIAAAQGFDTGFGLVYAAVVGPRDRTPGLRELNKTIGLHSLELSAHHEVGHIHHWREKVM